MRQTRLGGRGDVSSERRLTRGASRAQSAADVAERAASARTDARASMAASRGLRRVENCLERARPRIASIEQASGCRATRTRLAAADAAIAVRAGEPLGVAGRELVDLFDVGVVPRRAAPHAADMTWLAACPRHRWRPLLHRRGGARSRAVASCSHRRPVRGVVAEHCCSPLALAPVVLCCQNSTSNARPGTTQPPTAEARHAVLVDSFAWNEAGFRRDRSGRDGRGGRCADDHGEASIAKHPRCPGLPLPSQPETGAIVVATPSFVLEPAGRGAKPFAALAHGCPDEGAGSGRRPPSNGRAPCCPNSTRCCRSLRRTRHARTCEQAPAASQTIVGGTATSIMSVSTGRLTVSIPGSSEADISVQLASITEVDAAGEALSSGVDTPGAHGHVCGGRQCGV